MFKLLSATNMYFIHNDENLRLYVKYVSYYYFYYIYITKELLNYNLD